MSNLRIVQVPGGYALRQVVGNGYLLGVNNSVYLTYAKAEAAKTRREKMSKDKEGHVMRVEVYGKGGTDRQVSIWRDVNCWAVFYDETVGVGITHPFYAPTWLSAWAAAEWYVKTGIKTEAGCTCRSGDRHVINPTCPLHGFDDGEEPND